MKEKQVDEHTAMIELKANELVTLIKSGGVDGNRIKAIQQKINKAANSITPGLDIQGNLPASNDLEVLLSKHELHKEAPKKAINFERIKKYLLIIIGGVMITLGMAMIIMPAPPYFEMFTIFHFTANDGVTLMDLIALVIVFTGIYLPLSTLSQKSTS